MRGSGDWDDAWDAAEQAAQFERHRQRSIHVHCWTQEEFLPVLVYAVAGLAALFRGLAAFNMAGEIIATLFPDKT